MREKLKSFWSRGPRWLVWLKRCLAFAIVWPLITTLLYAFVPVPITNLMIVRLIAGHGLHKTWRSLDDISEDLPRAVIASEDQRFCAHHGVDWAQLMDATHGGKKRPSRGASTISMQVAKNIYLWEGHSYIRKGLEIPLAIYMDAVLSKRRMMEIYLNIVEWAPGVYGAEAAAQLHFGKPASRLNAAESALLAASLPNPIKRIAGRPSPLVLVRANHIRKNMVGTDFLVACLK